MSTAAAAEAVMVTMEEAKGLMKIGITKLREMVQKKEITTRRDGVGRGFRIFVRRDEALVYGGHDARFPEGGIDSLRTFRRRKGRA